MGRARGAPARRHHHRQGAGPHRPRAPGAGHRARAPAAGGPRPGHRRPGHHVRPHPAGGPARRDPRLRRHQRLTRRAIAYGGASLLALESRDEPVAVWPAIAPLNIAPTELGQAAELPLVGREHELALLLEHFIRVRTSGWPQLVTLLGDAGMGKSRLVAELRQAVAGDPAGAAWVTEHLRLLVGAGEVALMPGGREEALAAWRRFLYGLAARRRALVLVVEDLHWADYALLDFLDKLTGQDAAGQPGPLPLLVLATARPELEER